MAANVNNYIAAGRAAVNANNEIRAALAKGKPQVDKIGNAAITANAREKAQAMKNNRAVAGAAMDNIAKNTNVQREIDSDKKIRGYKKNARMAGMLAGGAALIGVGAINMNKKEEENELLGLYKQYADKYSDTTSIDGEISAAQAHLNGLKGKGSDASQTTGDTVGQNTGTSSEQSINSPLTDGDGSSASPDFKSIVSMATTAGAKHPQLVAAQWALESGWGKTPSGKNNYFGIKASANESGTSKATWEVYGGQEVNTSARFKNFDSPQGSVNELVNRWYKDYDGYSGVNRAGTAREAADLLVQEKYATDPNYASKLKKILSDQGY